MAQVNYYKVVSLPASLEPSSFYFAKGASDERFRMYLTNSSSTPVAVELDAVPNARTVSAGAGLSGGGNLSANRTLSIDTAWMNNRYGRLEANNGWAEHNHFHKALAIPSVSPDETHAGLAYIHFGAIGTGGETPPLVANLTDLQDVSITAGDQSIDGVVSWDASAGKFVLGNSIGGYIPLSQRGTANGVATLDGNGLVPPSQLPSYVDDVVNVSTYSNLPTTGESGKIYVVETAGSDPQGSFPANSQFRWTGSAYVRLVASPGTTDNVVEGSNNLYFTTARARAAISAGSGINYSSGTGVISINRTTVDTWYEASFTKNTAFNRNFGVGAYDVARGNHTHTFASLTSKPTTVAGYGITNAALNTTSILAGTGLTGGGTLAATRTLNVSYGTTSGTAAQGNDSRILNGQTAFNKFVSVDPENGNTSSRSDLNPIDILYSSFYYTQGGASEGYPESLGFVSASTYSNGGGFTFIGDSDNGDSFYYARRYAGTMRPFYRAASREWVETKPHTYTAHNHFDSAISIPTSNPSWPHTGKTYIHFGAVGSGGSTPPLVANLGDLQDVSITGEVSGQVLQWDGTNWVNGTVPLDLSGYVPNSRFITAGTGLAGGGNLSQNRTLSINRTVVDTWYSAAGHTHTFSSLTSKPTTLSGYGITNAVASNRTITAGTGLTGGGALSGNITLNVSYGTTVGTAAQGNDSRINNGQTAYEWGDFREYGLGLGVDDEGRGVVLVSDLNDTSLKTGLYIINANTTNAADSASGTVRIGITGATGYITQQAQHIYSSSPSRMFIRHYSANINDWTNWVEVLSGDNLAAFGDQLYVSLTRTESIGGVKTFSGQIRRTGDATGSNDLPRLSQVTTLITNATSWSQEAW